MAANIITQVPVGTGAGANYRCFRSTTGVDAVLEQLTPTNLAGPDEYFNIGPLYGSFYLCFSVGTITATLEIYRGISETSFLDYPAATLKGGEAAVALSVTTTGNYVITEGLGMSSVGPWFQFYQSGAGVVSFGLLMYAIAA